MVVLKTERLDLREFVEDDWPATYAYESDPEVVRYEPFGPYSPEESRAYIQKALAWAAEVPRRTYELAVVLRVEGQLIGRCGLQISDPDLREGMLWYILNRSYWGRGYATEAVLALLEFGFRQLRLHRLWGDADPANAGSIRVLQKAGLRQEAHFRENARIKGAWVDSLIFAILDREWR